MSGHRLVRLKIHAGVTSSTDTSRRSTAAAISPPVMPPWRSRRMYISHHPLNDISHSVQDFRQLLHAGEQNNVDGRFLPDLPGEIAAWCPPDKKIQFYRYNPAALRAFWRRYRQDATYNLTRRNCSTTVIGALDSALEGVLGDKHLWRRFLLLVLDPTCGCWRAAQPWRKHDLDAGAGAGLCPHVATGHRAPTPTLVVKITRGVEYPSLWQKPNAQAKILVPPPAMIEYRAHSPAPAGVNR